MSEIWITHSFVENVSMQINKLGVSLLMNVIHKKDLMLFIIYVIMCSYDVNIIRILSYFKLSMNGNALILTLKTTSVHFEC